MGLFSGGEREFETGKDEAWASNMKNTYDQMQKQQNNLDAVTLQIIQNAVTVQHQANQYAVTAYGIAIDRLWNVDIVAKLEAQAAAMGDVMAARVAALILEDE